MSAIDFRLLMKQERLAAKLKTTATAPTQKTIELDQYKLNVSIKDIFYIPNFLTKCEEKALLTSSYTNPKWSSTGHRRLQHFGGIPHASGMIPEPLPLFIQQIFQRIQSYFPITNPPNHVLLNEYTPPGGKISPHKDGSLYYSSVAIISMKTPAVFEFFETQDAKESIQSLLLMPRSLLVFRGEAYTNYWHGIRPRKEVRIGKHDLLNERNIYVCENDCIVVDKKMNSGEDEDEDKDEDKDEDEEEQKDKEGEIKTSSKAKKGSDNNASNIQEPNEVCFQEIFSSENDGDEKTINISCSTNRRISFTVRHVLSVVDREPIVNENARDERERRTRVFLQGASDD